MKLKSMRYEAGLSQMQMASECNASQASICSYETGFRVPSLKMAARIVSVLRKHGVKASIEDLLPETSAA